MATIGNAPVFPTESVLPGNLQVTGNATISGSSTTVNGNEVLVVDKTTQPIEVSSSAGDGSIKIDSSGRLVSSTFPCAGGTINAGTGSGNRGITVGFNRGFTISTPDITIPLTGKYLVAWKQLVVTDSVQLYYSLYVNDGLIKYAYNIGGNVYNDLGLTLIIDVSANDIINFHYNRTVTNSWDGGHSNWSILYLGS